MLARFLQDQPPHYFARVLINLLTALVVYLVFDLLIAFGDAIGADQFALFARVAVFPFVLFSIFFVDAKLSAPWFAAYDERKRQEKTPTV